MAALYHSIFTEKGLELLREAIQNGTKLGITHMSFGDGGGSLPTPDAKFTQMINEVYRVALNRLAPSRENANWLEADGVIPTAVGGFNIREVGLWAGDQMVAYANYPPTYKPSGDQGTAQIKTIRIVLQIDNTANFELKIDTSIVMATLQYVDEAMLQAKIYADKIKEPILESLEDLQNLEKWNGRTATLKSYHPGHGKGGGRFIYDENRATENDGGICINGWVRQLENRTLNPYMFGAYGDLEFTNTEVLAYKAGHDDTEAFKKMLNMNKYVIFTNISKAVSSNIYSSYNFELPHAAWYVRGTLPIRSFTKIEGNNSTIFFDPEQSINLFETPKSEMQAAFQINTGWNTQTISMCEFNDLIIIGNLTRTSTIHAQKCFDAANAYKWRWSNVLIERFQNGISIYPLDTSPWTGTRRGNFYENVLNNVTINECIQHFYNAGNVTQASNLTLAGGYVVSTLYLNKFDYFLINIGAGFSCNGFNIAPAADQQLTKALIFDACHGSYYSGGYTEWFNTFFELDMPQRMGGFKFDASHTFKYPEHCMFKFKPSVFSKYDFATSTRTVPNKFNNGRLYNNYLNHTGIGFGAGSELITNFFKYVPQYDFKYGLYGVAGLTNDIIYDVKRFESVDTGFTSRFGIRLINPTTSSHDLVLPLNNQSVMAKVVFLYRSIKNFSHANFKSNVFGFNGTNDRISTGELMVDYGNDWKLAVLEVTSEQTRAGNIVITLPANSQVEIEHVGAYANGFPFMPSYKEYQPLVNSTSFESISSFNVGGAFTTGDILRATASINAGTITGIVSDNVVMTPGIYSSRHIGTTAITLNSGINTVDVAGTDTLKRLGIGAYIELQQNSIKNKYTIVGRNFSNGEFAYNLTFSGNIPISAGNVLFDSNYMQPPTFRALQYFQNNYVSRKLDYSKVTIPANSIVTTNIILNGASMSDTCLAATSPPLGASSRLWAEVTSTNQLTLYHQNLTNSDIITPDNMILNIKAI
ncbi:phage tail protein [Acinetobacter baumannii]|uniref:phage tail protein n=1 Tax=Acinetobacter baumannii TaxID=470 RepID=UPI00068DCCE6|nr:phage tail protein [Acinetobacter baumannii]